MAETHEERVVTVSQEDKSNFKRLDQYLAEKFEDLSRTFIKTLFSNGQIELEPAGKLELKKMPKVGSKIIIQLPPPIPIEAEPENIPLKILFEDEHLIIVDKPAGLVVHPAPGNYTGTLVNAILFHCPDLKGIGDKKRPGIVHRLDKGTSGVMVVAKAQKAHEKLVEMFSKHDIERRYEAIAFSKNLKISGIIESNIGRDPRNRIKMAANVSRGKEAITHYKVLDVFNKFSHLELKLETGRTHQIRVHLSTILKAPILCDPVYANCKNQVNSLSLEYKNLLKDYPYQLLHAKILGFKHPITEEQLYFETPPPEVFQKVLELARNE